ncbi:MAG: Eco29kI family restriction endonuclease [Flavobacteriales bacterium]
MKKEEAFNPLDKINLGASVAEALLAKDAVPLNDLIAFKGAGIYALYYHGNFPAYKPIRSLKGKQEMPIYAGKAIPAGARKGEVGLGQEPGTVLYKRLKEHAESIRATSNLKITDFYCRYLVVDDIWIPLGEALVITQFSPLWNNLIDGFGNHDPGKGRYAGLRPRWDTLHPGRKWAEKCQARTETSAHIEREVIAHLKSR